MTFEKLLFSDMLKQAALEYGERPAVTCQKTTMTFSQLEAASDACALSLIRGGLKKGDRAVLWGFNDLAWTISFFGIIKAGGVAVLMNYGLKADDVSALTKMVGATCGIIGGNTISIKDPAAAAKALIMAGVPQQKVFPSSVFGNLENIPELTGEDKDQLSKAKNERDPKDTQVIIYTTGTTSIPKAVELSSYSILSNVEGVLDMLGEDVNSRLCLALPMFHSYGLLVMNAYLSMGKHVFLTPLLKAEILRDMIVGYSIEDMTSVGAVYGMLTQLPDFEESIAGRLKTCIVGGGFTTPVEMMRLEKTFDGAKILVGYGQTECSPVISVESPKDPLERRAFSVGRPLKNIEVKIWNEQTGFAAQGDIGEIIVKGPTLMNRYYGLPEDQQPFDRNGWLHTGDLGRIAMDGMLQFAGRIKDIIIRSGENISPVEIERVLLQEPAIREAKVLGAPHPIWGESVEACLVLRTDQLDQDDLRARLKKKLASFKIPSHFFLFGSFPLNSNGKLDQRGLKTEMLRRLNELAIAAALDEGLRILDLKLKNRHYSIVPACSMIEELAGELGFDRARSQRIRLSVEEMLTDRINNAYDDSGEIRMEVVLMPQWLRLRFTDKGKAYRLDGEDASISAKIILANVDAYTSGTNREMETQYSLDYQYRDDFDVKAYLMR